MREEKKHGYVELFTDSYEEFIELIRPDKKNLDDYLGNCSTNLLYRGQQDSNWLLQPSLFRRDQTFEVHSDTFHALYHAQLSRINLFIKGCDNNGIQIPSDSALFREESLNRNNENSLIDRISFDSNYAPPSKMYELLAFAQHYGIPTELLDWSKNPLIACFFMVKGVLDRFISHKNEEEFNYEGRMSLWVLNPEHKNLLNQGSKESIFEMLEVPKGLNRNISAQNGCFTLIRQKLGNSQILTWNEQNRRFQEIKLLDELIAEKKVEKMLLKISLPVKLVEEVLEYCEAYGVTSALIYGGAEGAAKYANDVFALASFKRKLLEIE